MHACRLIYSSIPPARDLRSCLSPAERRTIRRKASYPVPVQASAEARSVLPVPSREASAGRPGRGAHVIHVARGTRVPREPHAVHGVHGTHAVHAVHGTRGAHVIHV